MPLSADEFLSQLAGIDRVTVPDLDILRKRLDGDAVDQHRAVDQHGPHGVYVSVDAQRTSPGSSRGDHSHDDGLILTKVLKADSNGVTCHAVNCRDGRELVVRAVHNGSGPADSFIDKNPFQSPPIVPVRQDFEICCFRFLCHDHLAGECLDELVANCGPLPRDVAIDCLTQVVRCVHNAHAAGLVHGELRLSDWLLDDDGTIWLHADLPFHRPLDESEDESLRFADFQACRNIWCWLTTGRDGISDPRHATVGTDSIQANEGDVLPLSDAVWNACRNLADVLATLDDTERILISEEPTAIVVSNVETSCHSAKRHRSGTIAQTNHTSGHSTGMKSAYRRVVWVCVAGVILCVLLVVWLRSS